MGNNYKLIILGLSAFLAIGCATQEEKQARLEKKNRHFEQLKKEIKFYNYNDPQLCTVSKECRFIMSYSCWADTPDFEKNCQRRFLATAKKYAGDTYLYTAKPELEGKDLTLVNGEIYSCSSDGYKFPERYVKSFKSKEKYAGYRVRFIPAEYNKKCGILNGCESLQGLLKCSSSRNNAAIRCYKYLKRHIPKTYPTYLINDGKYTQVKNSSGMVVPLNYNIKGTIFSCPEEKTSALQKYSGKIYNDMPSDFESEQYQIDNARIKMVSGVGNISVINTQLSKDVLYLRKRGGYYLDLHGPSSELTRLVKNELSELGYTVTNEAAKSISIYVDTIESFPRKWIYGERTNVIYKITLGNAETFTVYRESVALGEPNAIVNDSLAKVAIDILNNERVRQYLKN